MYKEILIENKKIPMLSNGGTLREYRRFFKRDLLSDFIKLEKFIKDGQFENVEFGEIVESLAWVLAYKANPTIKPIDEWVEQFQNPFAIINAFDDIFMLLNSSINKGNVKPKKQKAHHQKKK